MAQHHHLVIVCGVPGSGKSTWARHVAGRHPAVTLDSVAFTQELGAAARDAAGDLTREAMIHAYAAMAKAAAEAVASSPLVLAVGSFRSAQQRAGVRDAARTAGAAVTTLRIVCPVETAAHRVRLRMASGERGPSVDAIRQIDAEIGRASDIDAVLANDGALEEFYRRADDLIARLLAGPDVAAQGAAPPSGHR